jgi:hypothetical protein
MTTTLSELLRVLVHHTVADVSVCRFQRESIQYYYYYFTFTTLDANKGLSCCRSARVARWKCPANTALPRVVPRACAAARKAKQTMCQTSRGAEALLEPRSSTASRPGGRSPLCLAILLQLIAWTLSLTAVALAARAHAWTLQQFESYSWTHSSVDAAVGAIALSVASTAAQCCGAFSTQLVLGVALGVALLVKRSTLRVVEGTAVAVVTVAAVSPWIWALAALVHRRHRSALATRRG